MILAISVVTGFQDEIRNKVIGFGSHVQINANSDGQPIDTSKAHFYPGIQDHDLIEHIQIYATKPAIIQNAGDTILNKDGEAEISRDIQGVICKGIGNDFDWRFLKNNINEGTIINTGDEELQKEILISQHIADKLKLKLNDKIDLYFLQGKTPGKRIFKITGIYETGFEEYDKELVLIDIRHIQKLNNWGSKASLNIKDTCINGRFVLEATCYGGMYEQNYRFDLGNGYELTQNPYDPHLYQSYICIDKDTSIRLIAAEFMASATGAYSEQLEPNFIPDTAWLDIEIIDNGPDSLYTCDCINSEFGDIQTEIEDDGGYVKVYKNNKTFRTTLRTSGGTFNYYVGGFEVTTTDWKNIDTATVIVERSTNSIGNATYDVNSIKEIRGDIFGWLDMLDMNVKIILILTIFVAVINMSSALLVIILERTNMIGILKAMGASNWTIRKIFLYNAAYLILKGIFWGNVIGIGLCLLQQQFGLMKLPTETYYISEVPINLNLWYILLLNIGTLLLCTLAMIIPSYIITRISPVKAIKFN